MLPQACSLNQEEISYSYARASRTVICEQRNSIYSIDDIFHVGYIQLHGLAGSVHQSIRDMVERTHGRGTNRTRRQSEPAGATRPGTAKGQSDAIVPSTPPKM